MAKQLIDSLAGRFEPDKYHDTYREQVLDADRAQGGGQGDRRAAARRRASPVPDLMSALKASLDAVRAGGDGNGAAKPKPKKPATRKAAAKKAPAKGGRSRAPAKQ